MPIPILYTAIPADVQHWWKLDSDALDSKGTNNGTINYGTYTPGINGDCLNVASSIDFPNMDAITSAVGAQFSISFWVRPAVVPYVNDSYVFQKGAIDVLSYKFIGNTYSVLSMKNQGTADFNYWYFDNALGYFTPGVWSHVVITYDGGIGAIADRVKMYVDKKIITPSTVSTSVLSQIQTNAFPFTVGNDGLGVIGSEIHQLDDLRFYAGIMELADVYSAYVFNDPDFPYITGIAGYTSGEGKAVSGEAVQIKGTQFLRAVVCSEIPNNKVSNGAFCTTIAGWSTAVFGGGAISASWVAETALCTVSNGGINAEIRNCRFEFLSSAIAQNSNIIIQFEAKCVGAASKNVRVALFNNNDFTQVIQQFDFVLSANYQTFTTPIIAIASQTNIAVSFQMGGTTNPGDVQFNTINVQQV